MTQHSDEGLEEGRRRVDDGNSSERETIMSNESVTDEKVKWALVQCSNEERRVVSGMCKCGQSITKQSVCVCACVVWSVVCVYGASVCLDNYIGRTLAWHGVA